MGSSIRIAAGAFVLLLSPGPAWAQTAHGVLNAGWSTALHDVRALRQAIDDEALRMLASSDPKVRRRAAETLGAKDLAISPRLRDDEAPPVVEERKRLVAALVTASRDPDPAVYRAVVRTLAILLRNRDWGHHGEPWSDEKELAPLVAQGPRATPILTEFLLEPELHHGVKFALLRTLKQSGDTQVIAPLIAYTREERGFALSEALRLLASFEDPRVIPAIVENIDKGITSYEDTPGVWALRKVGKRAVPDLIEAMASHPRGAARYYATHTLVHIVDPRAVPALVRATTDPVYEIRREAVKALALQGKAAPTIPLRACLLDPHPEVRAAACLALGQLGRKEAFEAILRRLRDPDAEVRGRAVKALALLDGQRALRPILALRNDKPIQHLLADALGDIPGPESEKGLILLLREADADGKSEAARQLGVRRSTRAIDDLVKLFLSGEERVYYVDEALTAVAPVAATRLLAAFPRSKGEIRYEFLKILGATRDRRALPILRLALDDPKLDWPAVEALGDLGDPSAIPWLRPLLPKWTEYEKGSVMEALGKLKDRASIPAFLELLETKEYAAKAAVALGHIAEPKTLDALLATLTRNDFEGRWMVLDALGYFRDPRLVPLLTKELDHEDGGFGAASALGRIGDRSALPALRKALESDDDRMSQRAAEAIREIEGRKPSGV
ncbi:MAG: HEAT repeat domain-containing protein [Fimbriimonas sp.]